MQLIIPVAGKGSRLRPHTLTTAKPLMQIAGRTVMDHILDRFKDLPITELILITGHLGDQFKNFKAPWPIKMVEQKEAHGTAHAISMAKDLIHGPFIIAFADTIFDADLTVIAKKDPDGILWAKEVEDYQRFGVIVHKDGVITHMVEKPSEPVSKLANIGLYYIKDHKAFLQANEHTLNSKPGKGGEYYLTDTFQYLVDHGKKLIVEPVFGWYDTGTWDCMIETNAVLLARESKHKEFPGCVIVPPVWIEDGAQITRSVIGPNVSVGKGARIVESVIANSIVDAHAVIENAHIENSLIGESAVVVREKKKLSLGAHSTSHA